jgi:Pyridoxamine 5'-phosphate oxidase
MALQLFNEVKALLDGANFAHLATLMPDGSPQSAPVWVGREGDRILKQQSINGPTAWISGFETPVATAFYLALGRIA